MTTREPKRLEWLEYAGGEQTWGWVETGHQTAFQTITGPIFEFGFPDSLLQRWAAFLHELAEGRAPKRLGGLLRYDYREAARASRVRESPEGTRHQSCQRSCPLRKARRL